MFELYVASDAARRRVRESLEPGGPSPRKVKRVHRRRTVIRSTSAAALRGLANRLEPSASA
jgi:hypothetical protein